MEKFHQEGGFMSIPGKIRGADAMKAFVCDSQYLKLSSVSPKPARTCAPRTRLRRDTHNAEAPTCPNSAKEGPATKEDKKIEVQKSKDPSLEKKEKTSPATHWAPVR